MKNNGRLRKYVPSILLLLLFEAAAVVLWRVRDNLFYLLNFSYIGCCLALGTALFAAGKRYARHFVQLAVGGYMLLYLGVILSVVFLAAVVLLLYYKQITEGYEDQPRFAIMRNVGMTLPEIRRSIRSQMRTVFFLPLVGAGLHLVFAFPMVEKLLHLSGLTNTGLFAAVTAGCSLVFALFYLLTYRITSRSYYRIVSGGRERE